MTSTPETQIQGPMTEAAPERILNGKCVLGGQFLVISQGKPVEIGLTISSWASQDFLSSSSFSSEMGK